MCKHWGTVFADESLGDTKEIKKEGILSLVEHQAKYLSAEQRGTSVVPGAFFRPRNQA